MRVLLVAALVLLAGCASPGEGGGAATTTTTAPTAGAGTTTTTSATTTTTTTTSTTPPPTQDAPRLGVVLDETYDYSGRGPNETRRTFEVKPGVQRVVIHVESAGPPADRSFTSAVMSVYWPSSTSPNWTELPGEAQRSYNVTANAYEGNWGTWRIIFGGEGKTSVHVRVVLE